jgi:hypothetical protein
MKLVMTLQARDEEDIVASNIDFHLAQGVDYFIATDNLSVGRTTKILRSYERRGLLYYIYQPEDSCSQYRWVTHMARLAKTDFAADWVINNDADEFWYPEGGDIKKVLGAVPLTHDAVTIERTNFLPRPMTDSDFFADVMTVRWRRSLNTLGNPLPPKTCHRALPDVMVSQGNHSVAREGRTIPAVAAPITILHFPIRIYRQFANKITKGGGALYRNATPELAPTWARLYELYKVGELENFFGPQCRTMPQSARVFAKDGSYSMTD